MNRDIPIRAAPTMAHAPDHALREIAANRQTKLGIISQTATESTEPE